MLSPELMKYTKQQNNEQKPQIISTDAKKKKSKKSSALSYNFQQARYWNLSRKLPQLDKKESASNL